MPNLFYHATTVVHSVEKEYNRTILILFFDFVYRGITVELHLSMLLRDRCALF